MDALKENTAYLQGLVEGLEVDLSTKEGRIISSVVDTLADMSDVIDRLNTSIIELEAYVDEMDEDIVGLENEIYGDFTDEDGEYVEVTCPTCDEIVYFDKRVLEDKDSIEVTCPACEKVVFINDGEHEVISAEDGENKEQELNFQDQQ